MMLPGRENKEVDTLDEDEVPSGPPPFGRLMDPYGALGGEELSCRDRLYF